MTAIPTISTRTLVAGMLCSTFLAWAPMFFARGEDVFISEFVAANDSGLEDSDGESSDWIELHNRGDAVCDVEGWFLSDDPEDAEKWRLPGIRLDPGEYRVVFASDKNRRDPAGELHTNFKLKGGGEYLALADSDGIIVQEFAPAFPALQPDVAYGADPEKLMEGVVDYRFLTAPTPGRANILDVFAGPFLFAPEHTPERPAAGEDITVSVRVEPGLNPVGAMTLHYRFMYGAEVTMTMADDGADPDEEAGDSVYTGTLRGTSLFGPRYDVGEMVRWYFTARDTRGTPSRYPRTAGGQDRAEYFGTVAPDPSLDTELPVLHWFVEDEARANTEQGSRASAYFNGQFYDNFFVRRRGQFGAIGWPKPKLKFDFNPGDHFLYDDARNRVEEFNLQSHYADASYLRENVAFDFFNEAGTPAPDTRHWHVRRNGEFFGLFSFVEQVDTDFLQRHGLDPEGAMYKANGFPSTLAVGVTPSLYQKETRKDEPYDDLRAFVSGINGAGGIDRFAYIMDYVDIPAIVNEMACQTTLANADRLTKNYYMYENPATGLWRRFPWDMDGAFGSLNSENFASPLYGDSEHTQAPAQKIYQNFLLDAILDYPETREMYLRRVRTLVDRYLAEEEAYFELQLAAYREIIEADAEEDRRKWNRSGIAGGINAIINNALPNRRRQLLDTYGPGGQGLVPESQGTGVEVEFGDLEFRPASGNGDEEYFVIVNRTLEAVDMSGWRVAGAVDFVFPPGTVLPKRGNVLNPHRGTVHVVRDVAAFRARETGPRGGQRRFVVGGYAGQLSAQGESLELFDAAGVLMAEKIYAGDPSLAQQFLRVSEVHYHPAPPEGDEAGSGFTDEDFEFIELKNTGDEALDLPGVILSGGIRFSFPKTGAPVLQPGGYAVLVNNEAAFALRYGSDIPVAGEFEGNLANGGEEVRLEDRFGENIVRFAYADDWHPETDGGGYSLVAVDEAAAYGAWEDSGAWKPSSRRHGAPGEGDGGVAAESGYEVWKALRFTTAEQEDPAISGLASDPNGDGISNLLSYAFGVDPTAPEGVDRAMLLPRVSLGATGGPVVRYRRLADDADVSYRVETSPDMERWTKGQGEVIGVMPVAESGVEMVTFRLESGTENAGRVFARVRVSLNP